MTHFALDEQIASQPQAVREALATVDVPRLDPRRPVVFTGIGTSLHAAQVAGYWATGLSEGRICPRVVEAHDYGLRGAMHAEDQIVVISHRGTKRFPHAVLARAQAVGAMTISVSGRGAADPGGDIVLRTCADERAGAHTVSYTTALAVLGRLVARLVGGTAADRFSAALDGAPDAMAATLALPAPVAIPPRLINKEPLFITGFGTDAITAHEAALKLKEGTYLWAEGMSVELALHGTPAVYEPRHAALLIVPDADDGGRTAALQTLLGTLHVPVVTVGTGACDLPFAPIDDLLRPFVAILPLQRLVAELARRRGANPDAIRTDVEPYRSAMAAVHL